MQNDSTPTARITLTEATVVCPKLRGKRLHVSTLWRWCRRGCKARNGQTVRLVHARVGGTLTTTRADLDRFFADLAAADLESFRAQDTPAANTGDTVGHVPAAPATGTATRKPVPNAVRRAQFDRAKKILDEAGI